MNLRDEVEKIKTEGYSEANAESKLCQDIVLKAIAESRMARNATIKGGVVMRSLSKNARRATQEDYAFDIGFQEDAVTKSGKNWLDVPVDVVLKKDLEFIKSL